MDRWKYCDPYLKFQNNEPVIHEVVDEETPMWQDSLTTDVAALTD